MKKNENADKKAFFLRIATREEINNPLMLFVIRLLAVGQGGTIDVVWNQGQGGAENQRERIPHIFWGCRNFHLGGMNFWDFPEKWNHERLMISAPKVRMIPFFPEFFLKKIEKVFFDA